MCTWTCFHICSQTYSHMHSDVLHCTSDCSVEKMTSTLCHFLFFLIYFLWVILVAWVWICHVYMLWYIFTVDFSVWVYVCVWVMIKVSSVVGNGCFPFRLLCNLGQFSSQACMPCATPQTFKCDGGWDCCNDFQELWVHRSVAVL